MTDSDWVGCPELSLYYCDYCTVFLLNVIQWKGAYTRHGANLVYSRDEEGWLKGMLGVFNQIKGMII